MTHDEAFAAAQSAVRAASLPGARPTSPQRDEELRSALAAAQTAVDALTALETEPGTHQHRGFAQHWAAAKAHWESTLEGAAPLPAETFVPPAVESSEPHVAPPRGSPGWRRPL
jgi:hypothetical protein